MQERFERMLREQQAQIDALKKQLDAAKTNPPPAIVQQPAAVTNGEPNLPPGMAAVAPWSPAAPIRLVEGGQNYISLSFDALVAAGASTAKDIDKLELGGHDPKQRGFTVQNLETVFEGKVDPYFRGQANIVLQIDPHGDTTIEAEEAYLETMSLPWNLQVKAGQFFTEFGRLNPTHPHTWDFVDQPLVNGRFLGEDGLRSAGARLSWLTPTPFYSELFLTLQNSQGGTAFSFRNDHDGSPFFGRPNTQGRVTSVGDMLFAPRYAASFDLTDAQTFVTWQTEGMLRRFEAGAFPGDLTTPALPRETLIDYGLYSQVAYGFRKGWVAALRGDYVFPEKPGLYEAIVGPDPDRASRWRISPNLTWYPSEFSKIRLQYNYDRRNGIGDDHSVWAQFEFLLGTHAAHKF